MPLATATLNKPKNNQYMSILIYPWYRSAISLTFYLHVISNVPLNNVTIQKQHILCQTRKQGQKTNWWNTNEKVDRETGRLGETHIGKEISRQDCIII